MYCRQCATACLDEDPMLIRPFRGRLQPVPWRCMRCLTNRGGEASVGGTTQKSALVKHLNVCPSLRSLRISYCIYLSAGPAAVGKFGTAPRWRETAKDVCACRAVVGRALISRDSTAHRRVWQHECDHMSHVRALELGAPKQPSGLVASFSCVFRRFGS